MSEAKEHLQAALNAITVYTCNPLYGLLQQQINSAQHTITLINQLNYLCDALNSKGQWHSVLNRLENYSKLKIENKELRDKLESIKAALNDNPS